MADEATPPVVETPEAPVEPQKHQHSETILRVCDELEIPRESAELLDAAQLRTEIEDAERLLKVRQTKRGFQSPVSVAQQAPVPVVEEEVKLTPEEEEELADRPATKRAILEGKRTARENARLQQKLDALEARSSTSTTEQQVVRLLAAVPVPVGMTKEDRDTLIIGMLAQHHRAGHFQNVTFEDAVILMQKKYAPAPAARPTPPAPTRVHAPTNRLNQAEQDRLAAAAKSNSAANNGFGEP